MTTATPTALGQQLVDYCREAKWMEAIDDLYGDSIVSIEPFDAPDGPRVTEGIDAVRAKSASWMESYETHSCVVEGPFPHGEDRFAVIFDVDVTNKAMGQRIQMKEVALYTVAGGKIAKEEFFFQPPPQ